MKQSQQKTASFSWLVGLRWSFAGYVVGTLFAAGAGALDFPMLARAHAFGGGGLFCRVSCLCGGVYPEQQSGPLVLTSCTRDDYDRAAVRA